MRKDALENQEKILKATQKILRQKRIKDLSMKEIALNANVGIGTLYRKFPTKSDLCIALIEARLDKFISDNQQMLQNITFQQLLANYLQFREENFELLEVIEENQNGNSFYYSELFERLVELFIPVFKREFPEADDQKIQFKVDMTLAMFKSNIYLFERKGRNLSTDDYLKQLIDLLKKN